MFRGVPTHNGGLLAAYLKPALAKTSMMSQPLSKKRKFVASTKRATSVPRPVATRGIPNAAHVSLKYADARIVTSSGGITGIYVYRLNSLFDPDLTGTGQQPAGFDEYANLYHRYLVRTCHIDVEIQDTTGISSFAVVSAGNTSSSPTDVTDMRAKMSNPYSWHGTFLASAKVIRFVKKLDLAQITGVTKTKYNSDDKYQATVTNNPDEVIDLTIAHIGSAGAGNVAALYKVVLTYNVMFFDRKDLALS